MTMEIGTRPHWELTLDTFPCLNITLIDRYLNEFIHLLQKVETKNHSRLYLKLRGTRSIIMMAKSLRDLITYPLAYLVKRCPLHLQN